MTNTKTISFNVKGMTELKRFVVPANWDDRKIVSKMMEAYDAFALTSAGAKVIIEENDKAAQVCYYTEASQIDVETNPYATNPDWYILLTHTPSNFLQDVSIQPIQPITGEPTSDIHVVLLTEKEINKPLDEERLSIVKTMGNYQITRRFIVGTPDDCDLCDESFYQRWYFEMEFGDLDENGFIGYDIDSVDDTKPYELPEFNGDFNLFHTSEEAEAYIRSVQE